MVTPPGIPDSKVKAMKPSFKERYGERWKKVLYATLWKNKESYQEETIIEKRKDPDWEPIDSKDERIGDEGHKPKKKKQLKDMTKKMAAATRRQESPNQSIMNVEETQLDEKHSVNQLRQAELYHSTMKNAAIAGVKRGEQGDPISKKYIKDNTRAAEKHDKARLIARNLRWNYGRDKEKVVK